MFKLIAFIGCIFLTLIAVPVVKAVIEGVDLASVEGITGVELAVWGIIPIALLIELVIICLASLIRKSGRKEEK